MTDVELAIRMTADASDAASGMDDVGNAAQRMANDVEDAGRAADTAANRMDGVAESSDAVASKGAQAAGALSGLGELMGGPFGAAMQTGGVAMQAAADSGDLLNVVTESAIVRKIKDTAVTIAQKTAQLATAAATRTAAAAQWAWNAAMSANPIGLIIAAVVLLVGGFILLYKRSERFRAIVQAVMAAARRAIETVWNVLKKVGSFVVNVLIGYFKLYRTVVVTVFNVVRTVVTAVIGKVVAIVQGAKQRTTAAWQAIKTAAVNVWNGIRESIANIVGRIVEKATTIKTNFVTAFNDIKTKAIDVFEAIIAPIDRAIEKVKDLIDWIKDIDLPDLGDLNPFGAGFRTGTTTNQQATTNGAPAGQVVININVAAGLGNPLAIAAAVDDVVRRRTRYLGGS